MSIPTENKELETLAQDALVRIPESALAAPFGFDEKYVVGALVSSDEQQKDEKQAFFVTAPCHFHYEIVADLEREAGLSGKRVTVWGGGIAKTLAEKEGNDGDSGPVFETFGRSGGYGKPDVSVVRALLEGPTSPVGKHTDWFRKITVTDYIRG
jgi:hypothetical protein